METTVSIPVRREHMNKKVCLKEAKKLLRQGKIHGMSKRQLAREIYFHAVMYYYCERTGRFPKWKEHANPINLHDGGDSRKRRAAYAACWALHKKRS